MTGKDESEDESNKLNDQREQKKLVNQPSVTVDSMRLGHL